MAAPGERKHLLRVIWSCIGIFVGLSVFCVFGFKFRNWNVSLWGLLSDSMYTSCRQATFMAFLYWPKARIAYVVAWSVVCACASMSLPASLTLYVHISNKKGRWNSAPERLKGYMYTGCFIQLAGVCGFVTYLVLGIVLKQGLVIYGNGYYLTTVWCFMVWKWGFLLFYHSRQYMREFIETYSFLPKSDETEQSYSYS